MAQGGKIIGKNDTFRRLAASYGPGGGAGGIVLPHGVRTAIITCIPFVDQGKVEVMGRATLEERVAALEKQMGMLLANHAGSKRPKDWRLTRGAFTGDDLMKQVFEEGRKIREAERKRVQPRRGKKPHAHS
jgi:hypothetical protein